MNDSDKGTFVEITTREVLINGEPVMVEKGTLNVTMGDSNGEPMRVTMTLLPAGVKIGNWPDECIRRKGATMGNKVNVPCENLVYTLQRIEEEIGDPVVSRKEWGGLLIGLVETLQEYIHEAEDSAGVERTAFRVARDRNRFIYFDGEKLEC